ncbi:MAG: hypothetical protein JSR24_18255 [Proteobacteria bacterium]|nr:hypothetical protein [Pseudomonadota bacterium]
MRISVTFSALLAAFTMLSAPAAYAQQIAMALEKAPCPTVEPDSLQISWTRPCEEGDWLLDTQSGCRMWDWHPDTKDHANWSGACPKGEKEGRGVVQWLEHGTKIDRFEGTYRDGKREGFGRYEWNKDTRYQGSYANDVPDGFGTAVVAGETFAGDWKNGCLTKGSHVIAIGVPRTSCDGVPTAALEREQAASF